MKLTLNELLFLDDSFTKESLESQFGDKSLRHMGAENAVMTASPSLLLKLGGMLMDIKEGEEIERIFTETELWAIREVAISTKVRGQEKVGYNLKMKVYTELTDLYRSVTLSNLNLPKSLPVGKETLQRMGIDNANDYPNENPNKS